MSLRHKVQAWLIRRHPGRYFRWKRLGLHRLTADRDFLEIHARLVESDEGLCTLAERYNLWSLVQRTAGRPGALAEVGVYRGGSALVMAAAKGDTPLHLFDTFAGLPKSDRATDGAFVEGGLADTSLAGVQARLAGWTSLHFHAGLFPGSAAGLPGELRFKFVHLDVDLYRSTLDSLAWFADRLTPDGQVLVHDYNCSDVPGTKLAVDEFLALHPGWQLIELWETQALLLRR